MNDNLTAIAVILDQSGSMGSVCTDTIGGFNNFLTEQKKLDGKAFLTLCTFSDTYQLVHNYVPLNDVPELTTETYSPSGWTALLDAVGATVNSLKKKIASMQEADQPKKVVFVILTDGQENASVEYKRAQIKSMLEEQQSKHNWQIIFLGANFDSFAEGASIGVAGSSFNYTSNSRGTQRTYSAISDSIGAYRFSKSASMDMNAFADLDKDNLAGASMIIPKGKDTK